MSRVMFLCALVCALTAPFVATSWSGQKGEGGTLRLEASLDDQQYVQGQPILVLVKARNVGSAAFRDVGPMAPWIGLLRLVLERDGAPLPWTRGQPMVAYGGEGITLAPGEAMCEVTDLLYWYGQDEAMVLAGGRSIRASSVPPGHYTLHISFRARTGFVRSLPQVTVEAAPLTFDVTKGTINVPEESYGMVSLARFGAQPGPSEKRAILERGAESKAFYLLWRRLDPSDSDYLVHDAVHLLQTYKRSSVLTAAVLNYRCTLLDLPDDQRLDWIKRSKSIYKDPDLVSILESWRLKIEQKGYYTRH